MGEKEKEREVGKLRGNQQNCHIPYDNYLANNTSKNILLEKNLNKTSKTRFYNLPAAN